MSQRRALLVLICEDSQQESFVRKFLKMNGWDNSEIRLDKSPKGLDSGEQYVRDHYPKVLKAYHQRKKRAASSIVAIVDGDTIGIQGRINELDRQCQIENVPVRQNGDNVAIVVPSRNIETWIKFLAGLEVDEETSYPKLSKESGNRSRDRPG